MEKILIVEDDQFFREVYTDILRREGYEVDVATSGEEVIASIRISDYALIITDLIMGEMSGLDLLTRIKQVDPAVNVIIITGNANIDSAIYALKNGARVYLIKPFNHDEFRHSVALTMEQYRLINENNDLRQMVKLFQQGQAIANCLDLERLYGLMVETLGAQFAVTRGLGFFNDEVGILSLRHAMGLKTGQAEALADIMKEFFQPAPGEPCLMGVEHCSAAIAKAGLSSLGITEMAVFPIRSKTTEHGGVILFNDPGSSLPQEPALLGLNFLLDQFSLAFDNALRFSTTRSLIYVDELTGLYNYRYLDVSLEREIRRAERFSSFLSVAFVDLDLFKRVNDTYGHLVGSRVLRDVGHILKNAVREVDTVIRYGGDEFTIILVETGDEGAAVVSERIRKAIEDHRFFSDGGAEIKLTASIGFACYPQDTTVRKDLLEMADMAMYRGKAEGKNIVFRAAGLLRSSAAKGVIP
jgi:diguanylate cyclase (GGDEF)-like protein